MEPISARIKDFSKRKKISIRQIEQAIGASNGLLSKSISKKTDILSIWVSKIVETYPEIDPTWLLTGKGQMERDSSQIEKKGENEPDNAASQEVEIIQIQLNYCQDMIDSKEKLIKVLEETLELKNEKLKTLSSDNEKLKILLKACREKKDYAPPPAQE